MATICLDTRPLARFFIARMVEFAGGLGDELLEVVEAASVLL